MLSESCPDIAAVLAVVSAVTGGKDDRVVLCAPGHGATRAILFPVPSTVPTSHTSGLLQTTHALEVELVPRGWMHRPLSLLIPINVLAPPMGADLQLLPPERDNFSRAQGDDLKVNYIASTTHTRKAKMQRVPGNGKSNSDRG